MEEDYKISPEDFINAFKPQANTQQIGDFERGYFNASESMLRLTEVFLQQLKERVKEKYSVDVTWRSQGSISGNSRYVIFIPLTNTIAEMYTLRNDGVTAEWQYHNRVNYRS